MEFKFQQATIAFWIFSPTRIMEVTFWILFQTATIPQQSQSPINFKIMKNLLNTFVLIIIWRGVIAQNSYRDVRDMIMDVLNYQDDDGYIFEVDLDKTFHAVVGRITPTTAAPQAVK